MHKSYMWVYRSGTMCGAKQAAVYEYQKTRKADAAGEFLKGFEGTLVCDGYQVYHTLEDRDTCQKTLCTGCEEPWRKTGGRNRCYGGADADSDHLSYR